ncbi:hypothetical protein [Limosilactobacillus antri]|uniref:hypothetical protein n=1 Tax=Limosilactobacillus antri TaxID=227943 RepID=UPI001F56AFB3|nr:hypothetical protein [Limosilactobacillus antri]
MRIYNYLKRETQDVYDWLDDNTFGTSGLNKEELHDKLFIEDSVTGNGSGSYTFDTIEAERNLVGNYDLLKEALRDFGYDDDYLLKKGPESADVLIRVYLLDLAIDNAFDRIEDENNIDGKDLPF